VLARSACHSASSRSSAASRSSLSRSNTFYHADYAEQEEPNKQQLRDAAAENERADHIILRQWQHRDEDATEKQHGEKRTPYRRAPASFIGRGAARRRADRCLLCGSRLPLQRDRNSSLTARRLELSFSISYAVKSVRAQLLWWSHLHHWAMERAVRRPDIQPLPRNPHGVTADAVQRLVAAFAFYEARRLRCWSACCAAAEQFSMRVRANRFENWVRDTFKRLAFGRCGHFSYETDSGGDAAERAAVGVRWLSLHSAPPPAFAARGRTRRHRRAELDQDPVACRLDDASAMLGDEWIGSSAMLAKCLRCARLIRAHEPTVARDIGGKDCS
jgi:hypothetical protein